MKIFLVDRQPERWEPLWDKALEADAAPRPDILPLTMGADSALVRPGFPSFLPDFAREGWELRLAPMFRVGRLGKWIEPRFAPRYLEAITLAAILRPAAPSLSPLPFLPIFDGAITPGIFQPYTPGGEAVLQIGDESFPFPLASLRAEETLALISRSVTLKSGDLIVPAMFPAAFPAEIGLDIEAAILPGATLRARLK